MITELHSAEQSYTDLKQVFQLIRSNIEHAHSRASLRELSMQAGELITLTHTQEWLNLFGGDPWTLGRIGREEFCITAREITHRAKQIGFEAEFDELSLYAEPTQQSAPRVA